MTKDDDEGDEDEDEFWKMAKEFFVAYKDQIGKIIGAFAKNVERGPVLKFWTSVMTFGLIIIVLVIVAYLGILHIISGDAVAFLVGSVIGYLFSFLKQHLIGTG